MSMTTEQAVEMTRESLHALATGDANQRAQFDQAMHLRREASARATGIVRRTPEERERERTALLRAADGKSALDLTIADLVALHAKDPARALQLIDARQRLRGVRR